MLAGLALLALAAAQAPDPVDAVRRLYQAGPAEAAASLAPDLRPDAERCATWIDWVRRQASPPNLRVHELNRSGGRRSVVLAQFSENGEARAQRYDLVREGEAWSIQDAVGVEGQPTLREAIQTCSPEAP